MSLIVLSQIGSETPEELMLNSIIRAKFCEMIAEQTPLKKRKNDLFLMGLFSSIDTFLNRPMAEILAEIPIASDVKDALTGTHNHLRRILDMIMMYEQGEWETVEYIARMLAFDDGKILFTYINAVKWANGCSQLRNS